MWIGGFRGESIKIEEMFEKILVNEFLKLIKYNNRLKKFY